MTNREAIEQIKVWQKGYLASGVNIVAFEVAIQALEKQEPKKRKDKSYDGYVMFHCPVCNAGSSVWMNYCPVCGQALDMGD